METPSARLPTLPPVSEAFSRGGKNGLGWLRQARFWWFLFPALLAFLAYLPALNYELVWDDTLFLRDLPAYRQAATRLGAIFQPFVLSPNYFRPLGLFTFVAEMGLGGINPRLFHLGNILLHVLNTALVTGLALRLAREQGISPANRWRSWIFPLGAGLVYGLHPALIESVAFVSGRFDLLMTAFLLLGLLADTLESATPLPGRGTAFKRPLLVGLAFLLAALSKEMALAFTLALPCWQVARAGGQVARAGGRVAATLRKNAAVYAAVFLAGLAYLGLRYACLGYLLIPNTPTLATGDGLQHALLVSKSLAGYAAVALWPFTSLAPLHYSDLPVPLGDPMAWLAVGVAILAVGGTLLWARHAPHSGWLALGGLLALLPVSNCLPLELDGGDFMAERYLAFPGAFLALAVARAMSSVRGREPATTRFHLPAPATRLILPAVIIWLIAGAAMLQLTLPHWQNDLSLWTWAAARAPRSPLPLTNLALESLHHGQPATALDLAQQALNLDPHNANAWDNAGLALFDQEKYAEAQAAFEKALASQPDNALFWNNLAGALRQQGDLAGAEKVLLDQALRLNPDLPVAHLNLGVVYLLADRPDLASQHLLVASSLLPGDQLAEVEALLAQSRQPERWLRLGELLLANQEFEGAARAFDQARIFEAPPVEVAAGLSSALIALKSWDDARQVLEWGLSQAPQDARLYNNLGIVAGSQGDRQQARQHFTKAIELAADWEVPKANLEALDQP